MRKYEVMYIISPMLEEEAADAVAAKYSDVITSNGGEIEKSDRSGKRRLAYAVNDFTDGYYVLTLFSAPAGAVQELERLLKIGDEIIRYLIVAREE